MTVAIGEEPAQPQPVLAPLTHAAIFLVVSIKPEAESYATVRSLCIDLPSIFRAVDFRRIEASIKNALRPSRSTGR